MATVLAVDIQDNRASLLALQAEPGQRLLVFRSDDVALPDTHEAAGNVENGTPPAAEGEEAEEQKSPASPGDEPVAVRNLLREGLASEGQNAPALSVFRDLEIDSTLAVSSSSQVLYSYLSFPFRDQKKIEQVAPIQVQDSLPFEIEEFVLDSLVIGQAADGEYQVLSTLVPRQEVAATLASLQSVGIDPKILTTRASALVNLALLCHPDSSGLQAYVLISENHVSLAVLKDGTVTCLRELARSGTELESAVRAIACSLLQQEQQLELETETIHVIGTPNETAYLRKMLFRPVMPLDISSIADIAPGVESSAAAIASAIGVAASELAPRKRGDFRRYVDFRQGQFAYRRAWLALWNALKQEAFYIAIAVILGISWFGGRIYMSSDSLTAVNRRIRESVTLALPGEAVPPGGEPAYLQSKLDGLEEELRGMGSLSSLSPLESLKELVTSVGPSLDVIIDAINIGYSKMTIRGSVADNLSIGNLSTALKARSERFCNVKVDPKGKTGENRVGFTAEIEFCE